MKLALYSHDVGPRSNLAMIGTAARGRGWEVMSHDPPLGDQLEALLAFGPDAVITGLSSGISGSRVDEEIALGQRALRQSALWLIVADTHYAGLRPPARGHVSGAYVAPATRAEIPEYEVFGYPRGSIQYLGGPPMWQIFWTYAPVRLPGNPHLPSFYIGCAKDPALTDRFIETIVFGAERAFGAGNFDIILGIHPSEDGKPREVPKQEWAKIRAAKLAEQSGILDGVSLLWPDPAVESARIAISTTYACSTGGGTDGIVAAMHRRIPLFWETDEVRQRNLRQLGREEWLPAEAGALVKIATGDDVARAIARLQNRHELIRLAAHQGELYPRPSEEELAWPVAEQILDFLEERR
ncbi:hypothetical protein C4552_02670 [Candidatus Parcubacteria bacterium]|nr:MAG: hypothetical protein C4552_02670 [Candidatus Parcubacteria bacterium]